MSMFWKGYASVTDDVRHKLVEEAWFGRQVTGDITPADMPGMVDPLNRTSLKQAPAADIHGNNWAAAAEQCNVHGNAPATTIHGSTATRDPDSPTIHQSGPELGW